MNEREKQRKDFHNVAEERYARILASGNTIPWNAMRGYLEERLARKITKRTAAPRQVR